MSSDHQNKNVTGNGVRTEQTLCASELSYRRLFSTKIPLSDTAGEIIGIMGISRDTTERKRVETALNYERDLWRALLDTTPDCIYFKDTLSRFIKANEAQARQFGLQSPDEMLGKTDFDFFDEVHARPAYEDEQEIIRTGQPMIAKEEREVWKDGHVTWASSTKLPMRDAKGKIIGIMGITRDITEHKRMEAALNYERDLWQALLDTTPDCIYFKDTQSHFIKASKTLGRLAGVKNAEAIVGKTDFDLFTEAHARPAYEDEQEIIRTGEPMIAKEEREVWQDGHVTWASSTKLPMRDASGKIIGIMGISRDITKHKQAQENLQLFRALIEQSKDGIHVLDPATGRFLDANESACRALGYTRDELLVLTVTEVTAGVDLALFEATNTQLKKSGHVMREALHRRKDGTTYPVEVSLSLIMLDREYLVAIVRDITERKQAELALANERALLQTLVNHLPVALYLKDTVGRITLTNPQNLFWFNATSEKEILGKTDFDFFPQEQAAAFYADEQELMKSGQPMLNHEEKVTRPDGSTYWNLATKVPLFDSTGRVTGLAGIGLNITERKQAEASLARLAMAVEQSAESIVITDIQGTIIYVNPAFEKNSGYTRAAALGQNARILKSGKQEAAFYRRMWEVLGRGETWSGHFVNRRKDGVLYEEDATITPVRDTAGQIVNYVAVKRDVTREVQLDAQLRQTQKMEAIGTLAGGVAHDFNNILAIIQMQAGLLKSSDGLLPEQARFADEISLTVERAAALTRQLLVFSRKESPHQHDLDLNESAGNMAKMLRRILGENIGLELKLAAQPMFVHADAGMMDQVLLNLAVNARDAMLNGGRLVIATAAVEFDESVRAQSAQARPGAFVCLSVTDTGCGIPPENLQRIFEPFFTTKAVGKGTGLGLATVFGIVQQHQGWINLYSEVGHGTTFKIYLPRLSEMTHQKIAQKMLAPAAAGQETILLVEDEQSLRVALRMALARLGYRILEAPSGGKALAVWQEHRAEIRLVLTDLMMPDGMSGKELAQQLQQENPRLKVIYMSGYSAEIAGKDLALQEGINFLAKPFEAHKLAQVIRDNLDKAA